MPGCTDLIPEMRQSDFEAIIAGKQFLVSKRVSCFVFVLF